VNRAQLLPRNLTTFLKTCSLEEIELILRSCARELHARCMPDTVKLFDVARTVERFRLGVADAKHFPG